MLRTPRRVTNMGDKRVGRGLLIRTSQKAKQQSLGGVREKNNLSAGGEGSVIL